MAEPVTWALEKPPRERVLDPASRCGQYLSKVVVLVQSSSSRKAGLIISGHQSWAMA